MSQHMGLWYLFQSWDIQYSSRVFSISLPFQWVIELSGRIKKIYPSVIPPISVETLQWKHRYFSGIAEGWLESYVLYLAWPEWKGLQFYSPLWNTGGLQGDHRVNIIKLQVMLEWSLEWDCSGQISLGWEIENPLELYCIASIGKWPQV